MALPAATEDRERPLMAAHRGAAYGFALVLGVALALWIFPLGTIFPTDVRFGAVGDQAQHIVGQRYFIADAWRWPLLVTTKLGAPEGVNIAFTDGQPLLAVPAKLLRAWLPAGFHTITLFLAICWVLQPVAAVFALRSTGERRVLPALAVAVIAASMPSWYFRWGHAALCAHFLLLFALGLSIRAVRGSRAASVAAAALVPVALLIHPYIMVMVLAINGAAPLSLLLRWRRAFWWAASWTVASVAGTAGLAVLLGYGGAVTTGDYGLYSMNLLSPVYPGLSALVPGFEGYIDATGGQSEGYQYLGAGLLVLLVAAAVTGGRHCLVAVRRYPGLVLLSVALTAFAVSGRVYLGHFPVATFEAPAFFSQFRSSGRFFWPVAYILLVGAVAVVARGLDRGRWRGFAAGLLVVCAVLQAADVSVLRRKLHATFRTEPVWTVDPAVVRPLMASHTRLTILPVMNCWKGFEPAALMPVLLLASEVTIPVNTMYVARWTGPVECPPGAAYSRPLDEGELRVYLPEILPRLAVMLPDAQRDCRVVGPFAFCARDLAGRDDLQRLPAADMPVLPVGKVLGYGAGQEAVGIRGLGWSGAEPTGAWTDQRDGEVAFRVAAQGALRLTVEGSGFIPKGAKTQHVTVYAGERAVAVWEMGPAMAAYEAVIPAEVRLQDGGVLLRFAVGSPTSPASVGMGADVRLLGMFLNSVRIDPAGGAG